MSFSINNSLSTFPISGINKATQLIEKSMERLSTGKSINFSRDGSASMAKILRLDSHATSYNAAYRNILAGQAMLNIADVTASELSDLVARVEAIAVAASSSAITTTERASLQDEAALLTAEIDSLAVNTRYLDRRILDGNLQGLRMHNGTEYESAFDISLPSLSSTEIGSYVSEGPARSALAAGQTAAVNNTTGSEDIVLSTKNGIVTIDVADEDSAETVASKVNSIAHETLVNADARTYAHLFSTNASAENYTLTINGTSTSAFSISNSDVSDAVAKVNLISATTGVTASATSSNKVLLTDLGGDDIVIENTASGVDLDVQSVDSDAASGVGDVISLAAGGSTNNDATRVIGVLRLYSNHLFSITQSGSSSLGYTSTGNASFGALSTIDLSSASKASESLAIIESAAENVSSARAKVAAYLNRLESNESFVTSISSMLLAAKNTLSEADFAVESASLAKSMMLQKINSALLAQANAGADIVLKLLKNAS